MSEFKAKMHQNSISAGAPPQTPLGSLQRSFRPLGAFKGATSKERGRKGAMGSKRREESQGRVEDGVLWRPKILKIDPDKHPSLRSSLGMFYTCTGCGNKKDPTTKTAISLKRLKSFKGKFLQLLRTIFDTKGVNFIKFHYYMQK